MSDVVKGLRAQIKRNVSLDILLHNAANEIEGLRSTVVALKSDLRHYMQIANAETNEAEELRAYAIRLRGTLESIKNHAEFKTERTDGCDYVELSGVQSGQLLSIADELREALALPAPDGS